MSRPEPAGVRVAAAQYPIEFVGSWQAWADKLAAWVADAAARGAELLVFPEYASMELASLFDADVQRSLPRQLEALQGRLAAYLAVHAELARQHRVHLLAGSFPVAVDAARYCNRAFLFTPDGAHAWQDKLVMTRFENEHWHISAGTQLRLFDTALGRIGVTICYDVEFPLLTRALVEAGADLLLAPSCTDTDAGYHRVRIGAQARALESQCFVVHAATVGDAPWSDAVDVNRGAAGIYTPVDRGFPDDGVLAIGTRDVPAWVEARLDLQRARALRCDGQVLNWRDWPRQHAALEHAVQVIEPGR